MPEALRVLVCGGRDYADAQNVAKTLATYPIGALIQGGAAGADRLAKLWAMKHNVPLSEFKADWLKNGKAAGPIRNQRMLDEGKPDLVIAFPGGRGTADMVRRAKAAGIRVIEVQQEIED